MSFARLRNVLGSSYSVLIDSSSATVEAVQKRVAIRRQQLTSAGKTIPRTKAAATIPSLEKQDPLKIRPMQLLRKVGELTTPQWANMARQSHSWATRRYFWAIADPRKEPNRFRLNPEC